MPGAESVAQIAEHVLAAVHGAPALVRGVKSRADPFEIAAFAPIHLHMQIRFRRLASRALRRSFNGMCQRIRNRLANRRVHFRQMLAVQLVEFGVVRRAVLGPEPPAPVAAFRREQSFVRARSLRSPLRDLRRASRRGTLRGPLVGLARVAQQVPGPHVFRVPDPHIEIRVDPRRRKNSLDFRSIRVRRHGFAHGQRVNFRIVLNALVELPQKIPPVLRVKFPGILAVQNHADRGRASGRLPVANRANPPM